jgi:hypothetical protein
LGDDLDDLQLFEGLELMSLVADNLDHAGFVDHPGFCMTRDNNADQSDPRLCFPRTLFIGGSIVPGDDVFIAIQQEETDDYDPFVLVLDWRMSAPHRWSRRGKLSELISGLRSEGLPDRSSGELRLAASPRITSIEWGRIEIQGLGTFRDAKLFPGGARAWDWGETNTRHVPGIQPSDVQELLDNGSDYIVLSRGMQLILQTCPETIDLLSKLRVPFVIEETKEAVKTYNQLLSEGKQVGALIHSTC